MGLAGGGEGGLPIASSAHRRSDGAARLQYNAHLWGFVRLRLGVEGIRSTMLLVGAVKTVRKGVVGGVSCLVSLMPKPSRVDRMAPTASPKYTQADQRQLGHGVYCGMAFRLCCVAQLLSCCAVAWL